MPDSDPKDFEGRWPMDGDRLFVASGDVTDASLVNDPGERFYRLPMGYKRAGDILLDQAAADAMDHRNVIYAALFCYRHSIELHLKRLIETFGSKNNLNRHDLRVLWDHFASIASERNVAQSLGFDTVKQLVLELHDADQKSDGFRFPTDRFATPFNFACRNIDLANLRIVMQSLENFFECVYEDFLHRDSAP